MNRGVRMVLVACLVVIVCLTATSVFAQGLGCGTGAGGLGFYNYGYGQGIDTPRLPYYAVYPPVYYSYPVPRPYGYSPFAYPPGTMTPNVAPATTSPVIYNPFVPKRENTVSGPSGDKSASLPRTYVNPFVKRALAASDPAIAGSAR